MRTMRLLVLVVAAMAGCGDDDQPAINIDVVVTPNGVCAKRVGTYRLILTETKTVCGLAAQDIESYVEGFPRSMDDSACYDTGSQLGDCSDDIQVVCHPRSGPGTAYAGRIQWARDAATGEGSFLVNGPACTNTFLAAFTK